MIVKPISVAEYFSVDCDKNYFDNAEKLTTEIVINVADVSIFY